MAQKNLFIKHFRLSLILLLIFIYSKSSAQNTYTGSDYTITYSQSAYSSINYSGYSTASNCGYQSSDWTNDKVIKVGPGNITVNLTTPTNYIAFDYGAMDNNETITFVSVNGGGTVSFTTPGSGTSGCISLSNSNLLSSSTPGANGKVEIESTLPFTQIVFTAAGLYQVLKVNNFRTTDALQISENASSNITATTATISANVTSDGGATISERGFYYGTTATPTTNKTVVSGTTGSLSANLTGLSGGTTYYYRGFATNSNGTAYTSDGTFTTTNSVPAFTCPEIDRRNNGNGQASSCAGVNGTAMAANVVGTAYATVPTTAKTGDINFRWTSLPDAIPVITKVWINGVLAAAQVGPPSVTTQSGGFYKIEYCFYNVNLPNAGKYTLEFTDPQTGNVLGRCTFDGSSNVSTSEPTLNNNIAPVITGPNGTGNTIATTAAKSISENTTAVGTYTADKTVTWSISGTDASKFTISSTGVLSFTTAPDFENPSDTDTNNTYVVIVTATDEYGAVSTQTLTVTVIKDFDGDGISDDTDTDDDNDGILDSDELDCSTSTSISQALNPSPFYFVQWNSFANGVLRGVINVPGNPVNVTVTNTLGSIQQQNDSPAGGITEWAPQPSTDPYLSTFRSVTQGEHKFVFDQPVNNPRFFINSLNRTLDLSMPGKILKSNDRFTGTPTGTTTSVLLGNEANGTISFTGNVTEVSFTGRDYEFYCNFSLGIANVADYSGCIDQDTDGDGMPDRLDLDSDGDGVSDAQELADGTSPTDLCDFVLANQTMTPSATWNTTDCDGDGVDNQTEVNNGTNPLVSDIPVITGPNGNGTTTGSTSAKSIPENTTAVYTFTANKSVDWTLDGGEDAAKFSIDATTGALTFISAPDYEQPTDGSNPTSNTYIVIVKATDENGFSKTQTLTVTVTDVIENTAPTNIGLTPNTIAENSTPGATVGLLSSTDADAGDTHTYTLVAGTGDTNNSGFSIVGNQLKATNSFNYEVKNSYSVRIRTTDAGGLIYEKSFTIGVNNVNETPTNVSINYATIYENNLSGASIGTLSTTDVDAGDTFTYTLISGDTGAFTIAGSSLKAAVSFKYDIKNSYTIRVRSTDAGGLSVEQIVIVTILKSPVATGTGNVTGSNQITAASNNVTISKGYSSQLNVTGSNLVTYSWSPNTGLSATNVANPVASPSQTTTYAVTVTNSFGTSTIVYVTVTVIEDYNITPNNVLTPNGDGRNDVWTIANINSYPDNEVMLYDKAGRLIHGVKNYQNNWDGTVNGNPLKEDTYYYVIKFGGNVAPKKGYITIVR